jgi:transcriptional regulator with XRE-family HTH domain
MKATCFTKNLARILLSEREYLAITQKRASEISGVSQGHLSILERGDCNPSLEIMLAVLDIYGLELTISKKMNQGIQI